MSWTKVVSKRTGFRWDVFPFGGLNQKVKEKGITSFYVSEFPDYCNAKRLFEIFGCLGNVAEVAISPRRNRVGKRFAFARFREVEDGRILAIRLDNIQIEGKKIHVNLPRFDRAKFVASGNLLSSSLKRSGGHGSSFVDAGGRHVNIQAGGRSGRTVSYADALLKGQNFENRIVKSDVLDFKSNVELKSGLVKAYVGRVCIPGSAYNLQKYLEMEGVFAVKVTPLGGNCCLLEELEAGFIGDLIKEGESWWKSLFSSIDKWEAGSVDGCRDVWFRLYGVPLHAWCPDFFVALGELWGRFVCMDENTSKGEVFDVAIILVNIPILVCIPEVVMVSIDGENHKICVREDVVSMYRQTGGTKKAQSSIVESSESFDSELDRLMAESFSGCSDAGEGLEAKEGPVSASGGSNKKHLVTQKSHSEPLSGDDIRGLSNIGASSGGSDPGLVGSAARSVSDPDYNFIGDVHSISSDFGNPTRKGEVGCVIPGERTSVGSADMPEERFFVATAVHQDFQKTLDPDPDHGLVIFSKEIPSIRDGHSGRGVCFEAGTEGEKQSSCCAARSVKATDCINFDRAIVISSETSKKLCRSGVVLESKVCSDVNRVVPVSSFPIAGGHMRASSSKSLAADVVHSSSDSSGVNGTVGASALGDVGCELRKDREVNYLGQDFRYGGRRGGKLIRKASVMHNMKGGEKGRMKDKFCAYGKLKGAPLLAISRDNTLTCYGEQSEESDIVRNNGRQWDMLKKEVGDRLWEAMTVLGVMERPGMKSLRQGSKSFLEGGKENIELPQ